jgi:hypothetical protein
MRRLMFLLVLPSLAAQQPADLDQVLQGYYATQGGLAKLKAMKTRRVEGHFEGLGGPVSYIQINERPDHYWLETLSGPERRFKLFDGKMGWEVLPTGVRRQLLPGEVAELEPDFDGPLVDAQSKGHRLVYGGSVPVGYGRAHVIKASLANGDQKTFWFDAQSFRIQKVLTKRLFQGAPVETEMSFSDYRDVDGRAVAFKVGVATPGQAPRFSVVVDRVAFDGPVELPGLPAPLK